MKTDKKNTFWMGPLLLGAAVVLSAIVYHTGQKNKVAVDVVSDAPIYGSIPNFSLISSENKEFSSKDLEGKVWLANFIFTRCAGVCPMMSGRVKSLQNEFSDSNLQFVSFSVDPSYDTPEVLAKYAKKYEANPKRWSFLTGDRETIYNLSLQHFFLGVSEIAPEEREQFDQMIRHSSKLVLVDAKGRVRGYYDTEDAGYRPKLIQDIKSFLPA